MTKPRILLADDHAVLRAGLRLLIEAQADMTCVGAAGYVLKQAADQELLLAIRAVMRGEVCIRPAMTRSLLDDLVGRRRDASGAARPEDALSEREAEVIKQAARGQANQEIADRPGLSVQAGETHRARAMEKG